MAPMWNAPRTEISPTLKPPSACWGGGRSPRRATIAAALVALASIAAAWSPASAGDMKPPRLQHIDPDWQAVASDLATLPSPMVTPLRAPTSAKSLVPSQADTPLLNLNRATADLFPGIAASSVPVLLPFDTAAYLKD